MGCCLSDNANYDGEVDLNHFNLLRSVGKGAFGKVRVIENKKSKQKFAMKYINKAKCISMRAVENTIQERRLLEEVNHPFVCNLKYAFQDDENLFMALDLMLGGDLRFHLERTGPFTEKRAAFYVAEVASALYYLHSKNIVHRDLKPDNLLVDQYGHVHLTDFNIALKYKEGKPMTAIAGSLAYMAPEILKKRGYFSSCDWWSLGVIAYEFVYSKRPFRGKNNQQLTQSIVMDTIHYSETANNQKVSEEFLDFAQKVLTRDINQRLGAKEGLGFTKFAQHAWFKDLDWDKLQNKELPPPFIPDSKKVNFDATHELEELLLVDNPLTAHTHTKAGERRLATGEPLPPEYLYLEEQFKVFDFTKPKVTVEEVIEDTGVKSVFKRAAMSVSRTMRRTTMMVGKQDPIVSMGTQDDTYSFKDVMEGREDEVLQGPMDGEKKEEHEVTSPAPEASEST